MNSNVLEDLKRNYLNSTGNIKEIAKELGISNKDLKEAKQILHIFSKRKRHYILNDSYFSEINTGNKPIFWD